MAPRNTRNTIGASHARSITLVATLFMSAHVVPAQDDPFPRTCVSAGYGLLIYQSGYGMERTTGFELAMGRSIQEQLRCEAGFRLGPDPVLPDIFLRVVALQRIGRWSPSAGIESGYTDRAFFEGESDLLRETRDAMSEDLGHWYIASHIEPLCFGMKRGWEFSAVELDVGTHYEHIGSTVRLNVNFLRIRKTL